MGEPTGLIAKSGIELLTFGTPNGYKASILLEELKEAYGTEYTWQAINIMKNTQKEPWYTAICPNGRIPAIVDHDRGDFAVFEGLAILSYLTKHYDPDHKLSFPYESDDHSVAEQWMAWQHGGLGPMQGQANHFYRFAKDRIPYATQRYVGETERLYGVLDARLAERDFLAGPGRGTFSVADISVLGWANIAYFSGITALAAQFPHVAAWFERCTARPAVRRGFAIPSPSRLSNETFEKRLAGGEEGLQEQEDKLKAFLEESKKQYNYKYASP
ncbi:putative glutathione s-transferase ii protein [Phaeoacremonium minimum UCRPA7]|uniref:Putative glutathione s-transferase ii protein n=1 Tax=Phaeoacremonium minimum (strain UCR-PA7) TaxID=1286976 RepID=R8BKM6_PHAM7|nr:putative glutathione s-transferase ii protein [Phaeoacremonium minimum UCRPA7]EON99839.1 putative glutathione s-transferase ii protein [Phaeoacremonium minimum UCRPA7]